MADSVANIKSEVDKSSSMDKDTLLAVLQFLKKNNLKVLISKHQ